jgi:hypothetical protein
MIKQLALKEQNEAIEILYYLTLILEEKASKNKKLRKQVKNVYDFLNKIDYTNTRPKWEIKEDPRQMKLFKE